MNALVVGGSGFIGSHLVDRLVEQGHKVTIFDLRDRAYDRRPAGARLIQGDLGQEYLLRDSLSGVDVVFHLAWTTIHETANDDPVADIRSNLIPSVRLLQLALRSGVKRVVFLSSGGTVYGMPKEVPIPEDHPTNPRTAYGITKLAVEKYLRMYSDLHGLDFVVLRPSVPYGPRQNPLGKQGAVAVFLYQIGRGEPITIWGDGSTSRDYFYVTDLCSAIQSAAQVEFNGRRIFNIGGQAEISLLTLVHSIEAVTGKAALVSYKPTRAFDAPRIVLDTRGARTELGWSPTVSLEDGLERTWHWMEANIQ